MLYLIYNQFIDFNSIDTFLEFNLLTELWKPINEVLIIINLHYFLRSCSVDSKSQAVLSRRQILASLEEEKSSLSSSPSSSSPRSPSLEEPVFSRACLLQSISQGEEWAQEAGDRWDVMRNCEELLLSQYTLPSASQTSGHSVVGLCVCSQFVVKTQ